MTKENAAKFLPLVQAMAEGKTIQLKDEGDGRWVEVEDMWYMWFVGDPERYRIKPEPRKPRELWIQFDGNGGVAYVGWDDKSGCNLTKPIRFVEDVQS